MSRNGGRPPKPARRNKPPGVKPIVRLRHPQSSNQGIVLFFGEAQAGKTSTLNFLFGRDRREISPITEAGTAQILEFRSSSPIDNLRVIDVPGLGSPEGLAWDAQVMASLKKFLDVDPELSHCIPHCVILVTRFDTPELSFGHPESGFVLTLKALNLLRARLLDETSPNLVVVLSHYMTGKRRFRLVPQPVLDRTKELVRVHTGLDFDPYIVLAENHAQMLNLSQVGNNYLLTNGDYYPENLIQAILSATSTSKSQLKHEYFHQILRNGLKHLKFKPVLIPLVDPERTRYRKFFEAMIMASTSSSV